MISVIMSVRDGENYVAAAVESILTQTYRELEFIIINDASNDSTAEILDKYSDCRIVRLHNTEPQGLTKSLNRGLDICKGTYIARHDADDISYPERFSKQVAFFDEHPEVGLLGTAYKTMDAFGTTGNVSQHPSEDHAIRWQMLFWNSFCHSSVMFRRSLLEDGKPLRYDENLEFSQDYDLWVRLLRRAQGANLQEPLVFLRLHQKSVSKTKASSQREIADAISLRQIRRLLGDNAPGADQISRLRSWYYGVPQNVSDEDLMLAAFYLLALDRFEKEYPGIKKWAQIQRQNWVDRFLTVFGTKAVWEMRHAPGAVAKFFFKRMMGKQPSIRLQT